MDLLLLADFVTLAEHRSFSGAARARHVTQPAFSRRIRTLEESMGVQLVSRATTPITLTPAGEVLHSRAKTLLAESAALQADMRALTTQLPKSLHIQMSNSLSSIFFPAWYKTMQARVKGLTFRLSRQRSHLQLEDVRYGRADFAIQTVVKGVPRTHNYSGTRQQIIGHDRLLLVRAAHVAKTSKALLTNWADSYMTACLMKALGPDRRAEMEIVFEGPGTEMSRGMALAGFGTALLPENLIADDLRDGYLVLADPAIKPLPSDILLIRADHPLSPLAESVWKKAVS
jgi:LysR family transcriptional regulator, hypochlorite-specific transcription factor HypT